MLDPSFRSFANRHESSFGNHIPLTWANLSLASLLLVQAAHRQNSQQIADKAQAPFVPSLTETNINGVAEKVLLLEWYPGWGGKTLLRTNGPVTGPLFKEWNAWLSTNSQTSPTLVLHQCYTLIQNHWGTYNTEAADTIREVNEIASDMSEVRQKVEQYYPPSLDLSANWFVHGPDKRYPVPPHPQDTPWPLRPISQSFLGNEGLNTVWSNQIVQLVSQIRDETDQAEELHGAVISNHLASLGQESITSKDIRKYARAHTGVRTNIKNIESEISEAKKVRVKGEGEMVDPDTLGKNNLVCRGFAPEAHYMLSMSTNLQAENHLIVGQLKTANTHRDAITGHAFLYIPSLKLIFDPSANSAVGAFNKVTAISYDSHGHASVFTVPDNGTPSKQAVSGSSLTTTYEREYVLSHALQIRDGQLIETPVANLLESPSK